jgi:hypothetical protein
VLGPEVAEKPFGIPFLLCVGSPLAEEYVNRPGLVGGGGY